jgi:hypothetical protein
MLLCHPFRIVAAQMLAPNTAACDSKDRDWLLQLNLVMALSSSRLHRVVGTLGKSSCLICADAVLSLFRDCVAYASWELTSHTGQRTASS